MKVAFELGLEGCSTIYVLKINNSTSRERFSLMNFHEWKCKKKKCSSSLVLPVHTGQEPLVEEKAVLHYLPPCVTGIKNI